jgi:DHA3 family tetracycline resistance protein-like MFS transporter
MWTGLTVSLLGDGIFFVAIAWQTYRLSNFPTALSLVGFSWSLPMVLFVLVGGVMSDRFDRRWVLVTADAIRGVSLTLMGLLAITGTMELWHLVALAAVFGVGQAFFGPAIGAIVPDIVPKHLLVEANSLDNFVRPMAERLVGPALGGFIVAVGAPDTGAGLAFLIDAGTFAISAIAVLNMAPIPKQAGGPGTRSLIREIREGVSFVRGQTWLWATLVSAAFSLLFAIGPFEVLIPFVVKNQLGGGSNDLGLVFAAGGVGAIVAALVMGQRGLPRLHITVMYLSWGTGIALMIGFAVAEVPWHAMVVNGVIWALFTIGMIVWMTLMHRLVPSRVLGRVSSLDWMTSLVLVPLSFALTGPLSEAIGVNTVLIGGGILGGIATFLFLFVPGVRDTERSGALALTEPDEDKEELSV